MVALKLSLVLLFCYGFADAALDNVGNGEFRFQVSVKLQDNPVSHVCSGVILTERWILTTGQCLANPKEITFVGVGSKTLWTGHTMKIERKIPHEGYNGVTLANNIGLIKLENKITYNDSTASVRLAVQNQPLPNTTVSVSGWDSPGLQQELKVERNFEITACSSPATNKFCGGAKVNNIPSGACLKDLGALLSKNGVLHGLQETFSCSINGKDTFITVSAYSDWIKKKLGDEASDLKFDNYYSGNAAAGLQAKHFLLLPLFLITYFQVPNIL